MAIYNLLVYTIGGLDFAVKRNDIVAIHPITQAVSTTDIEDLPDNIVGVIISGSKNVPVFSFHQKLGLSSPGAIINVNTKVVVIQVGQKLFGVIADQIPGVTKSIVKKCEIEKVTMIDTKFIRSCAWYQNKTVPLLEWTELFDLKAAITAVNGK